MVVKASGLAAGKGVILPETLRVPHSLYSDRFLEEKKKFDFREIQDFFFLIWPNKSGFEFLFFISPQFSNSLRNGLTHRSCERL